MPRRKKSPDIQPKAVVRDTVTLDRTMFQILHNAARSVFRQAIQVDNHSQASLLYLQTLDTAIEEGHAVLGTQRSYADQYMKVVGGLTEVQMQNAQRILQNEGLLPNVDNVDRN